MQSEQFDDIIKHYIDFVNQQVGAYMDALAGFAGNHVRVSRQVHRINRKTGFKVGGNGEKTIVCSSYEDPSKPDFICNNITRCDEYLARNAIFGRNEQQYIKAVLIFVFTYWEDEIRERLAKAKGVEKNTIISNIMGDLRVLRNVILHSKSIMKSDKYKELKVLREFFAENSEIIIDYELMHKIFVLLKQDMARMTFEWLGVKNAPFKLEDLRDFAIQK